MLLTLICFYFVPQMSPDADRVSCCLEDRKHFLPNREQQKTLIHLYTFLMGLYHIIQVDSSIRLNVTIKELVQSSDTSIVY